MNSLRKVFGFLLNAVMLAAFALSSGAVFGADKTYKLATSANPATASPSTVTATLTNMGNSSFNSFTLQVPFNYSLIGTPAISASKGTVTYNSTTRVVKVTDIGLPVGSGTNEVITVTMNGVASSGSCGTGVSGTWTAAVYTGSSLNGSPFSQTGPAATTNLSPLCYTVSGSTSAGGTVTCTPSPVAAGGSSICSVAVNPGFTFTGFSANCGAPTTATSCTVSNVQSNQPVTATFSQIPYAINGSTSAGGTVTCSPTPVFYNGSSLCSVAVNPGFTFTGFSANCGAPTTATSCTVSNVQSNQTVTASYTQIPYAVNGSAAAGGTVTCSPTPVFYNGSSICSVAVNALYTFTGFSANCGAPTTATSCTVSNVQSSQTVTATFVSNTLAISLPPTSAALGSPFGVTVTIIPGGATVTPDTSACGNATWASATTATSTTFTFAIPQTPVITACTIGFSAPNYAPTTLSNLKVYGGVLDCSNYDSSAGSSNLYFDPYADTAYVSDSPAWGLRRGPNKDGLTCVPVNYTFTNDGKNASFVYDTTTGQRGSFKYAMVFNKVNAVNGFSAIQPWVSWGAVPNSPPKYPDDFVPALACVNDAPTLNGLTPTQLQQLLPFIPNIAPYVTKASSGYPQYTPGTRAGVCVSQIGWTSLGDVSTGTVQMQYYIKAIDQEDTAWNSDP